MEGVGLAIEIRQAVGVALRKVFVRKLVEDALPVERRAGVIPGDGFDRGLVKRVVVGDPGTADVVGDCLVVALDIQYLHAAETAKLAFDAVEVAVVIAVGGAEFCAAPFVGDGDFADAVHRERQARDPRRARLQVLQIKARRWRVFDLGGGAQVVFDFDQQVRLFVLALLLLSRIRAVLSCHEVDIADRAVGIGRQVRVPHQAGGAVAQQVGDLHGAEVLGRHWQCHGDAHR